MKQKWFALLLCLAMVFGMMGEIPALAMEEAEAVQPDEVSVEEDAATSGPAQAEVTIEEETPAEVMVEEEAPNGEPDQPAMTDQEEPEDITDAQPETPVEEKPEDTTDAQPETAVEEVPEEGLTDAADTATGADETIQVKRARASSSDEETISLIVGSTQLVGWHGLIESVISSDPSVASVELNGDVYNQHYDVRGLKPGTTVLTIQKENGDVKYTTVTVSTMFESSGITLSVGTESINFSVDYTNWLDWTVSVSNSDIISVSIDYCSVVVAGKRPGEATVTVTGPNGETDSFQVTVKTMFKSNSMTLCVGDYADNYSRAYLRDNGWTVSVSDRDIISASIDYDFVNITGKRPGTATVTVTGPNGETDSFQVTVKTAFKNSNMVIDTGGRGVAATKVDLWPKTVSVSNNAVISASWNEDDCTIHVAGKTPGKATVTIKGFDGETDSFQVTVRLNLKKATSVDRLRYGGTSIQGKTVPKTTVSTKIGQKTYKATANSSGKFTFKIPLKQIGTKISLTFMYGKSTYSQSVTVTGPNGEINTSQMKRTLTNTSRANHPLYGNPSIQGKTVPKATVSTKIGKKTYKATANSSGKFTLKIPLVKIGTKIKLTFAYDRATYSKTVTVKKDASTIETTTWTFRDSTQVKVRAQKVHQGDYVKMTINGNTYKQTITKNANSLNLTFKIKKPGKYGIPMKTELYNKYNQRMAIEDEYVYKSDTVYLGDTMSTVRWLVDWNDPCDKSYSAYSETWYYDWNGDGIFDAYLYFRNGKVKNWYIY